MRLFFLFLLLPTLTFGQVTIKGKTKSKSEDIYFAHVTFKDINGNTFEDEVEIWGCDKCDAEFEDYDECEKHEKSCGKTITCFRCGCKGHISPECYAKTHIKGYYIR